MALLGAIGSTLLMFILPVLFDWQLFGFTGTGFHVRSRGDKAMGCFCLGLGGYAGIIGTFAALHSLWVDVVHGDTSHVAH
jgi:hypothetical protein